MKWLLPFLISYSVYGQNITNIVRNSTFVTNNVSVISTVPSGGGGGCTPSYANTGGTGNRTSLITMTTTLTVHGAAPSRWIDGTFVADSYWDSADNTGKVLEWDFLSGHSAQIVAIKFYQQTGSSATHGSWQFQTSDDNSTWTSVGGTFTLGGVDTQEITTMSGNSTFHRYNRLLGTGGLTSNGPYILQFEFKLCYQ